MQQSINIEFDCKFTLFFLEGGILPPRKDRKTRFEEIGMYIALFFYFFGFDSKIVKYNSRTIMKCTIEKQF